MGGYFSGRPESRAKCEGRLSIDVRRWARDGLLRGHSAFEWDWTVGGERMSSISVRVHEGAIELAYRRDGEAIRYRVPLTSTHCCIRGFRGERIWFRCPVAGCNRRVAKLYAGSRYFACRRCHKLAYQSQRYSRENRALTQAGKIRRVLGGPEGIAWPFPDKPKGMHWRTYERLREKCERYEQIANAGLAVLLARVNGGQLWEVRFNERVASPDAV